MAASSEAFLTVTDIAEVLHLAPNKIREQAQADPSKLGFPVCVVDKRVLIPRKQFLKWIGE